MTERLEVENNMKFVVVVEKRKEKWKRTTGEKEIGKANSTHRLRDVKEILIEN